MYVLKDRLPPTYDSVVTFASNLRPPPTFHDVWNMLLTQEALVLIILEKLLLIPQSPFSPSLCYHLIKLPQHLHSPPK
jgi:hypothetical protein